MSEKVGYWLDKVRAAAKAFIEEHYFQEALVFDAFWQIFELRMQEWQNVVLDACHMSKEARWHSLQGPNTYHRKICVVFDLPLQTIRERCLNGKRLS